MSDVRYWIGFNLVPRIGPARVSALLDHFHDLEAAWHASATALRAAGLTQDALEHLLDGFFACLGQNVGQRFDPDGRFRNEQDTFQDRLELKLVHGVPLFHLGEFQLHVHRDGGNGMLVDQLIGLSPQEEAEIIEALDDPFQFTASGQFDGHPNSIFSNLVEKLILDADLILDHVGLPSSPEKVAERMEHGA